MVVKAKFLHGAVANSKKINTFATQFLKQIYKAVLQDVFNYGEKEGNLQEVRKKRG